MNAREVIAKHLCRRAGQGWSGISPYERGVYRTRAHNILAEVDAAGFTIMSKEDVEAVRDKALEEAAQNAECHSDDRARRYSMDWNDGYIDGCKGAAAAIRSLKSKKRKVDS